MKRIYACLGIVAALLAVAFYSSFRVQMFAGPCRRSRPLRPDA